MAALVGCQTPPAPVPDSDLTTSEEPVVSVSPPPPPTPAPRPNRQSRSQASGSQRLLAPEAFRKGSREQQEGFAAHGFALTKEQYSDGYVRFLSGRQPSQALENQYRLILEEQLLALAWMNSSAGPRAGEPPDDSAGQMALLGALADATLERWPDGRPIREADIRALYDLRADRYRRPERAHVRLILVPTAEDAAKVRERLAAGETFGQLAATESRHESRSRFGELDPFARGTYEPAFEQLAFRLAPGEVDSLETASGVFILQKVASIPPVQTPYGEVREELLRELRQTLRDGTVERLREQITDSD